MKVETKKKRKKKQEVCIVQTANESFYIIYTMVTWVEKDNSSKAPQFCLIHLHVPHLWHQLCQHSAQKQQETVRDATQVKILCQEYLILG